jgi:D-aminopeptidase
VGRTGTASGDGSGDIFLAFSTAPELPPDAQGLCHASHLPHHHLDPLFEAVVDSVDESIVNALVAARTMVGRDDHRVEAIDTAELLARVRAAPAAAP